MLAPPAHQTEPRTHSCATEARHATSLSTGDTPSPTSATELHQRPEPIDKNTYLCHGHIIPDLGARKLPDLSAADVNRWLAVKANTLSTSVLGNLHSALNRAVKRATARDKVKRNVVMLCTIPKGQDGRPSKSMTLDQARAVLDAAEGSPLYA